MEPHSDLERRGSINNLIERLTAELGPDGSSDGQYSPFGSIRSSPSPWQPAAPSSPGHPGHPPHPLFGGERHKLHFGSGPPPPPAPPYQADPVSAGPAAAMGGELGTAQISDNLAAHLNGFDTPLFDPRQPPPPPPPGSFLSSWLGGWLGCSAPQPGPAGPPPPDVSQPPPSPSQPRPPQAEHQPHQMAEPPPPPPPPAPPEPSSPPEPVPAPAVTPVTPQPPPSPASAPPPSSAPATTASSRPSYSAVLAKPAPATGPTPRPAERGARQSASRAAADPETPGGGGGGGGGRRGGRGRRRRVSEAESRPVREEAAVRPPAAEEQPPRSEPTDREPEAGAQKRGKTRKLTRTVSAGEVVGGAAGRRSETLNNNPDRAQPAVPAGRRPLSYNNNLGPSSTLGPAQTHVHTPPTSAAADGDAAKKVDVNVGKQKNCGKTSNETKKVDITLSKPDNKTLSQSRGSQPLNLLTSGGAAKSERVNKDLAFRARSGGGRGGGRGRRTAEEAAGGGGELLRRLRGQLWPGVALLTALLSWLLHLVLDVAAMSADLLWTAARSSAEAVHGWLVHWLAAGRAALTVRLAAARAWLARPSKAPAAGQRDGLPENIALPTTGDEAMTRLLACKDSDPYSILGVTHDCSDADIRKYYRRQALLVHPDKSRCPGADEAFKILQRAFQLVGAPEKRAEFDSQAREKHEVNEAFRQYMDEMMTRLREKIEETQNTLRCNNCNKRHRRTKVERPVYAARSCTSCQIRHAAREGDIWAESRWLGLLWRYYACMDGAVFDISEWAACQSQALKHLQANHHTVQYRIISGAKRHRQPADEPPDRDLEDILNNLCSGSMSGDSQQGRRRGARRRPH